MSKTDAAYMRAYRARKKLEAEANPTAVIGSFTGQVAALKVRVAELEEEVRHLKEELAKRSIVRTEPRPGLDLTGYGEFNTHPFTPVPKKR